MFLDIIVLILLILALFKGWGNGLIVGVFSFLAFVIGLAIAMKLSKVAQTYIGEYFNVSDQWLPIVAFAVVFLIVVILVRLGAKAIESVIEVAQLGWVNKIGGILLYTVIYLFIFSLLLSYAGQLHLLKEETLEASQSYPFIHPIAPAIMNVVGAVLPFFKDLF
ncbi:CvpA family protein [Chitinophagaceae bacterium LB-8]|jgi:membrane protein required for colicin V production|uniref:CvpA family protein n=1 Tax=Paraflavisolibacter caeni TaxID=2982496 RepID=A0A9X3BJV4_9BACT|nr:CvpA family protein [Paraflavisolibacter caeni]MCU7551678.1 CvpA family protein [Paraflavisolibacter caeni]